MATIAVNGTTLYYELRGEGPPVVFISGAPGDAGFWTEIGDLLADEYTVLSYDRRGTSRSPRPEGWTSTSMDEQADDAAALLEALGPPAELTRTGVAAAPGASPVSGTSACLSAVAGTARTVIQML